MFVATEDTPDHVAAHWVTRIDRHPLTQQEQQDLTHWLNADIKHKGAFLRAQAIWHATDRAQVLYTPTLSLPQAAPPLSRRLFISSAVASSVGAFFVPVKSSEASQYYSTGKNILHCPKIGESQVILDCYSQSRDFSEKTEISAGRAYIKAKQRLVKTTHLNFVLTGDLLLSKSTSHESGIVVKGSAIIKGRNFSEHKTLSEGEQILFTRDGKIEFSYLEANTLARLTAWTTGQVSLERETLSEATDIFNRYNQKQLIPSFRLADLRVSGMFDLNRPDIFALAAKTILNAHVREDTRFIYLD